MSTIESIRGKIENRFNATLQGSDRTLFEIYRMLGPEPVQGSSAADAPIQIALQPEVMELLRRKNAETARANGNAIHVRALSEQLDAIRGKLRGEFGPNEWTKTPLPELIDEVLSRLDGIRTEDERYIARHLEMESDRIGIAAALGVPSETDTDDLLVVIQGLKDAASSGTQVVVAPEFDLHEFLAIRQDWSRETFGEGAWTEGVCQHIEKELAEIRVEPQSLTEWIDVALLAFDGAWRAGHSSAEIVAELQRKQAENEAREWERTSEDEPSLHVEAEDLTEGELLAKVEEIFTEPMWLPGERNQRLLKVAREARDKGEGVFEALTEANRNRCDPPLSDKELYTISEGVFRESQAQEEEIPEEDQVSEEAVADPAAEEAKALSSETPAQLLKRLPPPMTHVRTVGIHREVATKAFQYRPDQKRTAGIMGLSNGRFARAMHHWSTQVAPALSAMGDGSLRLEYYRLLDAEVERLLQVRERNVNG